MAKLILAMVVVVLTTLSQADLTGYLTLLSRCANATDVTITELQAASSSDYAWLPLGADHTNPCSSVLAIESTQLTQSLVVSFLVSMPTFRNSNLLVLMVNAITSIRGVQLTGRGPFAIIDLGGMGRTSTPIVGYVIDGDSFRNGRDGDAYYYTTLLGLQSYTIARLRQYVGNDTMLVRPPLALGSGVYSDTYILDVESRSRVVTFLSSSSPTGNDLLVSISGEFTDDGHLQVLSIRDGHETASPTTTGVVVPPTSTLLTLPPSGNEPTTTIPVYVWIIVAVGVLLLAVILYVAIKRKKDIKLDMKKEQRYRDKEDKRFANVMRELGVDNSA